MVLSTPAAHAAPPAAPWLDRLSRIFELGRGRGVLVLIRGRPERLGDVVRCVVGLSPDADVLLQADQLSSLPPGSTVVLPLRSEDFDWLNIGRPVVLGHRVVLFGDPETALALEQRSLDFADWISHRIDAPPGPPRFAVNGLRAAALARSSAIVWGGGDVDSAFAEALPGRTLVRVSAAQPYADLVLALTPRPKQWVLITDLDEEFRIRRAQWATAEARRYGRTLLMEPAPSISDIPVVHGRPMTLESATAYLAGAGLEHGARLAALLDLEPAAIERAAAMARAGVSEEAVGRAVDDLSKPSVPARERRARAMPDWPQRISMAFRQWDEEVALRWATAWRSTDPDSARATATLGWVRLSFGRIDGARDLLEEAVRRAGAHPDAETEFEVRRLEGRVWAAERDPGRALPAFEAAIRLAREVHRPILEVSELRLSRVWALVSLGRHKEAERAIDDWPSSSHATPTDDLQRDLAIATLRLARGETESAARILQRALDLLGDRDSPQRDTLVQMLAQALLDRGAFEDAERLTRLAVTNAQKRGRATTFLRHEHARALLGLGRFVDAEGELRALIGDLPEGPDAAGARRELSRSLSAQGRLEEAEAALEEALAELRRGPAAEPASALATRYQKAHLLLVQDRFEEARALLRTILADEERALGRDHPTLVQTLTALADSLIQSGDPTAAPPLFRRAQRIAERAGDATGLAVSLGGLAVAEATLQLPQAAHTARRALDAWNRTGREVDATTLADLEAIAAGGLAATPPRLRPPSSR